ncbi:hypothetical protein [Paenibacillus lautus]|uniref:hypothetical protein n=1 Tax=Paenibacillus lautus TaxID=1401 RepID=UPI003D9A716F
MRIKELEIKEKRTVITEDTLRKLFSGFKTFVMEKNIPEIKKFIQHYVEKVVVHEEHVDVIFKLDIVGTLDGGEGSRTPVLIIKNARFKNQGSPY